MRKSLTPDPKVVPTIPAAGMNRQQVILDFGPLNDRGRFIGPGKFEGEFGYVALAWDAMMNGVADDHPYDDSFSIAVTAEDRANFPELGRKTRIRAYVDDQGFVREW